MAAPWNPPVKGEDFETVLSVNDLSDPGSHKSSPTIAAGDFQVSKDNGAYANLATLPTVSPAGTEDIVIQLSATEMTADKVKVRGKDQTDPKEWADIKLVILTTA